MTAGGFLATCIITVILPGPSLPSHLLVSLGTSFSLLAQHVPINNLQGTHLLARFAPSPALHSQLHFDHLSHNLTTGKGLAEAHEKSDGACLTSPVCAGLHDLKWKSKGKKQNKRVHEAQAHFMGGLVQFAVFTSAPPCAASVS